MKHDINNPLYATIMFNGSYVVADSGINYCYDQVGDGHHCFKSNGQCISAKKIDDLSESLCYNENIE